MPILKIRDENGNFIPIPAIRGANGKSAFEQAKEGGYIGTEEAFIALLNGLTATEDADHYADFNNPHRVTKEQIGLENVDNTPDTLKPVSTPQREAIEAHTKNKNNPHEVTAEQINAFAVSGGTVWGDMNVYGSHYPTFKVGTDDSNATAVIYTPNKTVDIYNWTNGQPTTLSIGNSSSMLLRDVAKIWVGANDYQIYGDHNANELGIARVATGSYKGTNTYGTKNPCSLTFDFVPKMVVVAKRGSANATNGSTFLWIAPSTTLNFINNGSTYWCYTSLSGTTLSWYSTESSAYQLNSSNYDYDYVAWG